jgi:hypothetical protein
LATWNKGAKQYHIIPSAVKSEALVYS